MTQILLHGLFATFVRQSCAPASTAPSGARALHGQRHGPRPGQACGDTATATAETRKTFRQKQISRSSERGTPLQCDLVGKGLTAPGL